MIPMTGLPLPPPPQGVGYQWAPPQFRFEVEPCLYAQYIRNEVVQFRDYWQRRGDELSVYTTWVIQSLPATDEHRRQWIHFYSRLLEIWDFLQSELELIEDWEQWEYA